MSNTEAGNKLIAEFMGGYKDRNSSFFILPNRNWGYSMTHYPNNLKYHCDWQWLMPVGKKIRDILTAMHETMPKHSANQGDLIEVDIMCRLYEYDIEKTWQHIVQFIQWYNTNSKGEQDSLISKY